MSFGASTVYTCSMFSVLSKTMVFLSATVLHRFMMFTQVQCRKCCFDVYKLLMSNDIDCPLTSWSIYCGDEKQ